MERIDLNNYQAFFLDFVEGNLSDRQKAEMEDFLKQYPHLREELNAFENVKLPIAESPVENWVDLKKPDIETLKGNQNLREEFFFKAVENTLQPLEESMLDELLQNHAFRLEFDFWKKTKLSASNEEISKDELFEFGLDQPVSDFNFEYYLVARTEGLLTAKQNRELEAFAASKPDGNKQLELADRLKLQPASGIFFPDKEKLYKKESRTVVLWFYRAASVAVLLVLAAFVVTFLNRPFADKAHLAKNENDTENIDTIQKNTNDLDTTGIEKQEEKQILNLDTLTNSKPITPIFHQKQQKKAQSKMEMLRADVNLEKIEIFMPEEIPVEMGNREPAHFDLYVYEAPYRQMEQESKLMAVVTSIPAVVGDFFHRKLKASEDSDNAFPIDMAKRFGSIGDVLNAEIKKETTVVEGEEILTYSFRIGNFEVSRSKTK